MKIRDVRKIVIAVIAFTLVIAGTTACDKNHLSDDLQLITKLLGMTKTEAVSLLGKTYTIVDSGGEGWLEGYYFAEKGMTLSFYKKGTIVDPSKGIKAEDFNKVLAVSCNEKVDLNGARVGMTLNQFKAALGNPTKIIKADESYPVDIVYFKVSTLSISVRLGGNNGTVDFINISKAE
jgi:hypothetical protein